MAAVDVRVGHQNNFVIAQLPGVEIVFADAGAQRGDDGANFLVAEHLVVTRLLNVKNFALERKNRLIFAIAAHLRGAARGLTLDDEKFAPRGIALLAISKFSRQAARIHRGLAARQLARFASGFAGARRFNALADNSPRHGRVLVKPFAELLVDELLDIALDVAVELAFGLSFKLRLRQPHADHGDQAFANVIARDGDFVFLFLEHASRRSEVVDRARQRGSEAGEVRAAIDGIYGVRKSKYIFTVGIVVLQRDFDLYRSALPFDINRRIMQRGFPAIQMLDELRDAARELEFRGLFGTLIGERDQQALIQKGQFAQALRQSVETVDGLLENRRVGMEGNFGPGFARLAGLFQLVGGLAFFVSLFPDRAIARNFQLQPIGKRVDDGDAHAVETT